MKRRILHLLIALDQLAWVVLTLGKGYPDETISADVWERSNPFLQQMWAQLGGTTEQLDELYRLAVTL